MVTSSLTPSIQERFDALLVSTELANDIIGKKIPGKVVYQESEQGDARRRLLFVEKQALKQKVTDARAQAAKVDSVSEDVHSRIIKKLTLQFSDTYTITDHILTLSDDVALLLDTLSTKACTVSKLESIVSSLPWLQDSLLRTVNAPEFRKLDNKDKSIAIESVRTALSALGIENLKIYIPYYILNYATPQVTDPFPRIKDKLAKYYLGVANCTMQLCEQKSFQKFEAYTLGMFSGLGACVAIRQYFREFDRTITEIIEESIKAKDQMTYNALRFVQPSASKISEVHATFSADITTRIFEYMLFKRLRLLQIWEDSSHPVNQSIIIAQKYAQLKLLLNYRLIEKVEAKEALHGLKLNRTTLELLGKSDTFSLHTR